MILYERYTMKSFIYLFMIIGFILQALFIKAEHEEKYLPAVILKGTASLMFVLIGYNAFMVTNNAFNKQFLIGLIFGIAGTLLGNLSPKKSTKEQLAYAEAYSNGITCCSLYCFCV